MIGTIAAVGDDKKSVLVMLDESADFKLDQRVNVQVKRSPRRDKQNAFYWVFLQWCIENGLRSQGHFSASALHEDCKAWAKMVYSIEYTGDFSTADLSVMEFSEYFERINFELMCGFFGIDTSEFHADYEGYLKWLDFNPAGNYREYKNRVKYEKQTGII